MNEGFAETILNLSALSILLPLAAGLIFFRTRKTAGHVLWSFFCLSALFELSGWLLSRQQINNMPLFHLFSLVEYLCIAIVFYLSSDNRFYRTIILVATPCYLCFTAIWQICYTGIYEFNTEVRIFEAILLVFYALFFFNLLAKEVEVNHEMVLKKPMFWVSSAVLFYFAGNFFLFLYYKKIGGAIPEIWYLHAILNILANSLYAVSFLCRAK